MINQKMSRETLRFYRLKNSRLSMRPGSLTHFFVWMLLIDTFLMLLVTLAMVIMVNKIKAFCVWITTHSWLTIVLILLRALPVLILGLLKLLGYRREIDHFSSHSLSYYVRWVSLPDITDFRWGLLQCRRGVSHFLDGE
uniref:Uncharacterized protein n=1 Tax=Trichobilharzia regenti TaxID=157069 RepID=A0AA85J757_TRIRE|nr:unnamed protein product [Trichobilharzia regenti]